MSPHLAWVVAAGAVAFDLATYLGPRALPG
jgi:hypothetical protein